MFYIECVYKGSVAFNSVMSASKSNLVARTPYTENAINYHAEQGNLDQVKFFRDELTLIQKRLKTFKL